MKLMEVILVSLAISKCTAGESYFEFLRKTGEDVYGTTDYGNVLGKRRDGFLEGNGLYKQIDWYLGIPYASRPKRFQKPVPPVVRNKTFVATRPSNICIQITPASNFSMSEDCLYLNIFSPVANSTLLPVMFYIHGGSYAVGTGNIFVGDNLAQHGVVVVTINYRLSVFGFLSAGHPNLNGNYGLYDQIEALTWVQNNINHFRGDPKKVTIFGNSAGGGSVGLLSMIPKAKGLFYQVIMQSGSPLAFWAMNNLENFNRETYVRQLASKINCDRKELLNVVKCLENVNVNDIFSAAYEMPILSPILADFAPVIDNELLTYFPENNKEFVFDGPFMAGVVSQEFERHYTAWFNFHDILTEGNVDLESIGDREEQENFIRTTTDYLFTNYFVNYTNADIEKIYDHYKIFHKEPFLPTLKDFLADIFLVIPTFEFAHTFHNLTGRNTYIYQIDTIGNCHESELNYIFGYKFEKFSSGQIARLFDKTGNGSYASLLMMKLWTNFAKYGTPNGIANAKSTRLNQEWLPLSDTFNYYVINDENSSMTRNGCKSDDLKFWRTMKKLKVRKVHSSILPSHAALPNKYYMLSIITILIFSNFQRGCCFK